MPKKVSMDIIAKKLNISKNTVSLALRGMPGISESTRKTISDTAKTMGYQYKASNNTITPAKNLCLVLAKSTRESVDFYSFIQLGIEDEAKKNNINTIIHYYDEKEQIFSTPNCIKDGIISGIITLGRISRKTIDSIITYNLPIVMIDNYFDDLVIDYILTDNQCGCYSATKYLINSGHTKIGFIGDISDAISFYDRYQGYLKALRENKIEPNTMYSVTDKRLGDITCEDLAAIINEIKSNVGLPTAYVCCNDAEAIVFTKVLKNMGIQIPKELSIIGFDDIEAARNVTPELTTMKVQKEAMGKMAVCKLIEKIDRGESVIEKILLSAVLVKRQSVKQIRLEIKK